MSGGSVEFARIDRSVAERGAVIFQLVSARIAELGFPQYPRIERVAWFLKSGYSEGEPIRRAGDSEVTSTFLMGLFSELLTRARESEGQPTALADAGSEDPVLFPVYFDGGGDLEGFILSGLGEHVGARFFPMAFPSDIVKLGLTRLSTLRESIRFFSELTRIYGDAIGLGGEIVGFRTQLLPTLSDLLCILGELVRRSRLVQGDYPEYQARTATENTSNSADPSQNVSQIHSPSSDSMPGGDS